MIINNKPIRAMWLLNHSSARKFEIQMLKRIGIRQLFLPKSFPPDPSFRSASIDYSEDENLDIPTSDLQILNEQNWYYDIDPKAWEIANKYFNIIFLILHHPKALRSITRNFNGIILLRAYGLPQPLSYSTLLQQFGMLESVKELGNRFYFGEAYPHLANNEGEVLNKRRIFLPLGIESSEKNHHWNGKKKQIYFVCPDIGLNPYYKNIYNEFSQNFKEFNYIIAGAQPLHVNDPKVLGYVTNEQHIQNMTQSRVMFYHSSEPNHIHYHPFEAIHVGMPLLFMANGMLDRMGGENLPGRCKTIEEAQKKLKRIFSDDWNLINSIRTTQQALLEAMKPNNCEQAWRDGFKRLLTDFQDYRDEQNIRPIKQQRKRIAVILPIEYQGGSFRGALQLAQALYTGSRQWKEDADIVFLYPDNLELYSDLISQNVSKEISYRSFKWKKLSAPEACRAMSYAGFQAWKPTSEYYMVPDDGIRHLQDCDLWLIISDRMLHPILPLKPTVLMIYDYIQRYVDLLLPTSAEAAFLQAARSADKVLVTTEFTRQDALQYAGIDPSKVSKVPILIPSLRKPLNQKTQTSSYFLWTTNSAPHKNHKKAFEALKIYYEELDGQLNCKITGVNTKDITNNKQPPHLDNARRIFAESPSLKQKLEWMGNLPDIEYQKTLESAAFLWHAAEIDNGTFSVIEATFLGVSSLSSDYPAMREIDALFSLNLAWMDPSSAQDMAEKLKIMEQTALNRRTLLPNRTQFINKMQNQAALYWQEIRTCL